MLDALLKEFYKALDQVKDLGDDILFESNFIQEYSGSDDIMTECMVIEEILDAIAKVVK